MRRGGMANELRGASHRPDDSREGSKGSWWMSERSSGGGEGAGKGLQTEYEFTLPRGYVDPSGDLHRKGVMRLATAIDEIAPLRDPRVRANQAYLTVVLLARVVTQLGTLSDVSTGVIE